MRPLARLLVLTLVTAAAAVLVPGAASGSAASGSAADPWPMFHGDPVHSGTSAETPFTAANVATMAPDWRSYAGGPIWSSPVVAYSAALARTIAYVGAGHGFLDAFDAATGRLLWQVKLSMYKHMYW